MDGFAWSSSFHFLLYFFEAAEISFRLFLEFVELGSNGGESFWLSILSSFWVAFSDSSKASSFFSQRFLLFSQIDPFCLGLFRVLFFCLLGGSFVFIEDF